MSLTPSAVVSELKGDLTSPQFWDREWCVTNVPAPLKGKRARWHAMPALLAQLLDRRTNEPTDILELGCAPGMILSQLAQLRPNERYHGVDFCQAGLEQTKRLLASRQVPATLHQSDIREFAPERRYGLVYSVGLIEHFTDPAAMLAHHVRLCVPGGIVAVSVPNYRGRLQEWFIQQLDPDALRTHNLQIMDAAVLHDIFQDAGLQDVVAAYVGPPKIRSRSTRRSIRAQFLRRLAQSWNVASVLTQQVLPCRNIVWAYGRVA